MKRDLALETSKKVDQEVVLFGFVNSRRDHGKIVFFDLRDSSGLVQVVVTPKKEEAYNLATSLTSEDVVKVMGKVAQRPKENFNPDLPTGEVEVSAEKIEMINKSQGLPIPIEGEGYDIDEEQRFKYRHIDLRRERLQKNLRLRHAIATSIREFLNKNEFVEIETPYLSKTTPEGARDFIVPSRLQPGNFYALAQSPQQYKQLLMVAGIERYFQLARAFRDEDLRADRQFEHTQVDIELAFVERDEVLDLVEKMLTELTEKLGKKITTKPFPRFTYKEAQEKFGADKFDIRKNKDDENELGFAFVTDFPLFEYNEEKKRWTFSHNPFTAPHPKDVEKVKEGKEIESISSQQYDLVCNGFEIGSGSIRITDPDLQAKAFKIMGYSEKEIEEEFGHLLNAYKYGAPIHGGVALGFDRITSILAGEKNIREVIAFPISSGGQTSVMEAPSKVSEEQLKELGISVTTSKKKK